MYRQSETRAGNHRRYARTRNVSPPTQANNAAGAANSNPTTRSLYMHITRKPHTHHTAPCAARASGTDKAAIVGIGVTAQATAGLPKRHTSRPRAGPRAQTNNTERKHTNTAPSCWQRHEAPSVRRPRGPPCRGGPGLFRWIRMCVCARDSVVTKRRSSRACIGNPKPEQETIKGTRAQETSAYQRRPSTQHAAQGSNPPIRALYMGAGPVPVAPAVGAVLACLFLAPWWHRLRCDACVRSLFDACPVP